MRLGGKRAFWLTVLKVAEKFYFLYTKIGIGIVILMRNGRSQAQASCSGMIEDELLKWRFKCGSNRALCRIYEKYADYLLTLAIALLNDVNAAEDILHDVFVSFAGSAENFRLRGSLKAYLATCVINRARDQIRANQRQPARLEEAGLTSSDSNAPDKAVICSEESRRLNYAIAQLPYQQREAVILHLKGGMKFREIAKLQGISVNTVQGRYRYGLSKLRSILNGEVEK